ncbi:hypothetical protein DFJ74DRAFT_709395 [Hyaloraphidium curvatum]|nr:hypothetical protein DFJ74DRAFT_709395 [Hyaloraphidium curvatum]
MHRANENHRGTKRHASPAEEGDRCRNAAQADEVAATRAADGSVTVRGPAAERALADVGEQVPAVLLDWDAAHLAAALHHANQARPPLPAWLLPAAYPITAAQLQYAIVSHVARVAGGRVGSSLLAPNDLGQYTAVSQELGFLNSDPFLLAACGGHGRFPLARVLVFSDNQRKTTARPMASRAPAGVHTPPIM